MRKRENTGFILAIVATFISALVGFLANIAAASIGTELKSPVFLIILGVLGLAIAITSIIINKPLLIRPKLRDNKQASPKTITIKVDGADITIKATDLEDIKNVVESLQKSHITLEDIDKAEKELPETNDSNEV